MTIDEKKHETHASSASMVNRLATKALALHQSKPSSERVLIAIAGVPGSGKTTLAENVASVINAKIDVDHSRPDNFVAIVPVDGFHLYRSELASMPNPQEAIHRRGAAFTFNAERFYQLVQALREPLTERTETIFAPSFDHALKDPVEKDIAISRETGIVILEGLYLTLNREPWKSAASLMDELWFINVDREIAKARLIKRHVASGIVRDTAAAECRVVGTDLLNADDILANRLFVNEYIQA
ncbi:hypothetical protein NW761_011619 [Fusarium oxysporum]|nr:hypothetical protein NW758_013224 [Fusarium oxysporum]KAJ4078873.1 hypothetical protein NW761_011619 [Fusarium oxysporum]